MTRRAIGVTLLVLAFCTCWAGSAEARSPYPVIYKGATAYVVGVKVPGSNQLEGGVVVQSDGKVRRDGKTLYRFTDVGGGMSFYTPVPPGGGDDQKRPGNPAEAFANGIRYLLTANAPVVAIESGGENMALRDFVESQGVTVDADEDEGDEGGKWGDLRMEVAVHSYQDEVLHPDDVLIMDAVNFDEDGILKDEIFRKIRKRMKLVRVHNSAEIPTFFLFDGAEHRSGNVFFLYKFRGANVFARSNPEDMILGGVVAIDATSLTEKQYEYVKAGTIRRKMIEAGEGIGQAVDKGKALVDEGMERIRD